MAKPLTGKTVNCVNCNISFYVPKYRLQTVKFCSRKCGGKEQNKKKTIRNCLICQNEFELIDSRINKAKYCSLKCYHKGQLKKGTVSKLCDHCNNPYLTSPSKAKHRRFCSPECINKSNKTIWKPSFGYVRNKLKNRNMINKCERCGYDKEIQILGVHHKDRNRKNNDLSNLEILCPNCHSLEHMKHLPHGFKS